MSKPIRTADGRVVAVLDGQTLVKKVVAAQHMLRKPPSWAFDATTIEDALSGNATSIEVRATDEGVIYTTTMKHFLTHSFKFDRGHNTQLAMPLVYWKRDHDIGAAVNPQGERQLGLPEVS
mgnify:CR=1 FL=1